MDFDYGNQGQRVEDPKKPGEPKFYGPGTLDGLDTCKNVEKVFPVPITVFELFDIQKPVKQGKWIAGHFWRASTAGPVLSQRPALYPFDRGSKTLQSKKKIFGYVPLPILL